MVGLIDGRRLSRVAPGRKLGVGILYSGRGDLQKRKLCVFQGFAHALGLFQARAAFCDGAKFRILLCPLQSCNLVVWST